MNASRKARVRGALFAGTAALALAVTGCAQGTPDSGDGGDGGEDSYRIALVTGLISQPFYVDMRRGAEAEAEKLGVELQYDGSAQWDPTVQIPVFDAIRATKPDFLLAVPVNDQALVGPLRQFGDDGIPVLTVDTDVADTDVRMLNITSDNYNGGVISAQMVAEAVGEKGKVGIICYAPGITVTDERLKGFEDEIKKFPNIEYVGSQLLSGSSDDTDRVVPPFLRSQPDLAGMVVCDGNAAGRSAAIAAEAGRLDVKIVGFDVDSDLITALRDGRISALAVQQTEEMGAAAVRWAYEYLSGKNPSQENITLPFVKVTLENIDTPEAQRVIGPYDS